MFIWMNLSLGKVEIIGTDVNLQSELELGQWRIRPLLTFIPINEQEILQILKKKLLWPSDSLYSMEQWQLCSDDRIQIMGLELQFCICRRAL